MSVNGPKFGQELDLLTEDTNSSKPSPEGCLQLLLVVKSDIFGHGVSYRFYRSK